MAAGASAPLLDAGNDDVNDVNDDKQHHHHHPLFQRAATTEPSEAAKLFRESVKKHVIETRTETTLAARRKRRRTKVRLKRIATTTMTRSLDTSGKSERVACTKWLFQSLSN